MLRALSLILKKNEEHTELLEAFNDKRISNNEFLKIFSKCKDESCFRKLRRALVKLEQ